VFSAFSLLFEPWTTGVSGRELPFRGSVAGGYLSMARFLSQHPNPWGWNPFPYCGLPVQFMYVPALPYLSALGIRLLPHLSPDLVFRTIVSLAACLGPVTLFFFALHFTRSRRWALAAAVIHGPKVLFLDEPFEGVDAIAAGMLKTMLTGMLTRGATIFLTTHVLEIVERLCSHVAIISKGRLVANGSLEELRAGVASALPGAEQEQKLTLEEIFLSIVGADGGGEAAQELSWLA